MTTRSCTTMVGQLGRAVAVMAAAMGVAVVGVSGADHHTVDVAVYDASSGGVTAAIAASRHGADTLLICASWPACWPEGGLRVGGMSSGGLGETDLGSCSDAIGGIALEFYTRNRQHYGQLQPAAETTASTSSAAAAAAAAGDCRLPAAGCNQTFNLEPHVALGIFEAMLREANVTVICTPHRPAHHILGGWPPLPQPPPPTHAISR